MYACPHCQQPGISAMRRAFLGPATPATCVACGRKVGVPWGKSYVAVAPFALSFLGAAQMPSLALGALLVAVGAAAMFALFYLYVPLIAK
jgi:hypothetical protein